MVWLGIAVFMLSLYMLFCNNDPENEYWQQLEKDIKKDLEKE